MRAGAAAVAAAEQPPGFGAYATGGLEVLQQPRTPDHGEGAQGKRASFADSAKRALAGGDMGRYRGDMGRYREIYE